MDYRDNKYSYLTPDRKPLPDTPFKGLSTTDAKQIYNKINPLLQQTQESKEEEGQIYSEEEQIRQKLKWFQMRAAELRVYLTESPKIERRKIKQIFNWGANDALDNFQEKKLLKELGSKVRGLIKENHELRHHLYSDEINELKIENERLKRLVNIVNKGEQVREKILSEENQYMRNYIEQSSTPVNKLQKLSTKNVKPLEIKIPSDALNQQEKSQPKSPLFDAQPLSLQRLKNLKKYFTLYINTAIQQNDEKLIAQQKYIDCLEKRLEQLAIIDQKIDHLHFQRKVKLQQSGKKSKNFTSEAPVVQGDQIENQIVPQQEIQQKQVTEFQNLFVSSYFVNKQKEQTKLPIARKKNELQEEIEKLKEENSKLKESYFDLKDKYEIELEKHIKDNVKKEEIQFKLQKIEAEYRQLVRKSKKSQQNHLILNSNEKEQDK